ncbi:hypothetical protein [Candidatus Magnetominusculus xianensis]|uniref:Uncharacterized protein n=1 Tax=Candidatus Magnetominusculus xianensis TaxID=1748249 RepID=A0ABR5SAN6_9BACT|nr:hypothetical protein [Candidatus Magnetominusculus xianensis]KWT73774.1 hypothetical protein ASN18_3356 [Candidatus Magnetominusculus xianensis]MBF0404795.1 hypothetical protein [Nitrospirota bacterium]
MVWHTRIRRREKAVTERHSQGGSTKGFFHGRAVRNTGKRSELVMLKEILNDLSSFIDRPWR